MKNSNKVLAVFGNVVNFGQERSNTEVFRLLVNNGYNVLTLVNDRGFHWHLQPYFDKFHIPYKKIRFPWGISKASSILHILQWILDIILHNIQFIYNYLIFRPTYIHFGNEYMFKCLLVPLLFVQAKIIFRLGDEPFVQHSYNKIVWRYIICRRVKIFICVSKYIQEKLIRCGRNSFTNQDEVIYNFPPSRVFLNNACSCHRGFVVGFIGQISENKGVGLLAQAAIILCKRYSDVRFIFAGSIDNNLFAEHILTLIRREDSLIQERILFVGQIDDVSSFYNNLDICVTPSIYREALGNVIVEAKLYSKPSIIFRTGGMPELVHHCEDGYICSEKNIESLVKGIEYYIRNPVNAKKQGENAFKSIKKMGIDYESYKMKWLKVYS